MGSVFNTEFEVIVANARSWEETKATEAKMLGWGGCGKWRGVLEAGNNHPELWGSVRDTQTE